MDSQETEHQNLFAQVKEYFQVRFELAKIEFIEKSSSAVSRLISIILISFLSLFIVLFLFIGLALYLGGVTGHASVGFVLVAGIFVLITVLILLVRKVLIEKPLVNYQIKRFFKQQIKR